MVTSLQQFWDDTPQTYVAGLSDGLTGHRVYRNNRVVLDGTHYDQRMINWQRVTHRRYGVKRACDLHATVFRRGPTVIDLCPAAGHGMGGREADSHVLGGISTDKAGEYTVELYLAAGQAANSQIGGVLWCALEYQTCIEIENHNQPASEQRPTITKLVNYF